MPLDRYDKTLACLTTAIIAAICVLIFSAVRNPVASASVSNDGRSMERALALQARLVLLDRLYAPATSLVTAGRFQDALLKLEEINRSYPGEPYGLVLKGELLFHLGAVEEAVARYAEGVKRQGDYIDRRNPLSRRDAIEQAVNAAVAAIARRRTSGDNSPSLSALVANVNYLRSRLAGGCE